ncbi:hypothetical protein EVJ58_g5391 [Rhodofomes roseus]|uniref:Uncharacterized protein n=1 Tax=Rhodofomes roseus TaxID=34475 RepID=A0A4Y9YF12_9APHY|nr:hypothetical protein EVJ58_g5391 [Rhodofomes roseus]
MAAPSSSCSSSTEVRVDLAERISKARLDYAELPEVLCPSSRPSSPSASSRAEGMKQAIMDAVLMANSNTTHPKWGHVARMVRLNCTRRGYVGAAERVRIGDVQKAEIPEVEWTLPETEEDWERYVKRWGSKFRSRGRVSRYFRQDEEGQDDRAHSPTKKAEIIREKVTTWQATITPMGEDPTPTQDETSTITTAVNKVKVDQKGIGSQGTVSKGSLGFAIVKRPTALTKKQGKGSNQDALLADDAPNVPQSPADVRMSSSLPQSVATAPVVELQPPAHISSEPNAMISEVSEVVCRP